MQECRTVPVSHAPSATAHLGGLVAFVALGLRASAWARVASTIGLAAAAGVVQFGLLFLGSLPADVAARGLAGLECIGGGLMFGTMGSIVSAPAMLPAPRKATVLSSLEGGSDVMRRQA